MSFSDASAAQQVVLRLAADLAQDPHVRAEMQRARREFFPTGAAGTDTAAAELRFAEWFLCERESERLGAVPRELPVVGDAADDLADSRVGMWLVESVAGANASALDLQDDTVVDFVVPAGSLYAGDLVVGRLFTVGADRFVPSIAAAIFRPGTDLAAAVRKDLERLGLDRRLLQVEIEHLLLQRPGQLDGARTEAPPAGPPLEHLEADLEALLQRGGAPHTSAELSVRLAAAARPGAVIGPLLDDLAFDTAVDLEQARGLLLQIWNAHHADAAVDPAMPEPASPPSGETLGERLVRTLDEGLAQKRDVVDLFAHLERMAGIEPEPEEDDDAAAADDDDAAAEDEPQPAVDDEPVGNLAPLVEEFLWETQGTDDPAATPLRLFAGLQQNAALPHADLEAITSVDVLRFLLHVYLGSPPDQRSARVRAAFAAVRAFGAWAEATQEIATAGVLDGVRGALLDELERLEAAGQALSTPAPDGARPGIVTVEALGNDGFGCSDDDGQDHWLAAPPAALALLRVGDLVLGALPSATGGRRRSLAGLVVVLPADARALIE